MRHAIRTSRPTRCSGCTGFREGRMRKFRRDGRSVRTRLVVLIAALAITVVWAQSETRPRRGSPAVAGPRTVSGIAVAAPAAATSPVMDEATPEGWGSDPFDPRSLG